MPLGCATDEQLQDEMDKLDYDLHYCETHLAYYCSESDYCNPQKNYYPAMKMCRAYLRNLECKDGV